MMVQSLRCCCAGRAGSALQRSMPSHQRRWVRSAHEQAEHVYMGRQTCHIAGAASADVKMNGLGADVGSEPELRSYSAPPSSILLVTKHMPRACQFDCEVKGAAKATLQAVLLYMLLPVAAGPGLAGTDRLPAATEEGCAGIPRWQRTKAAALWPRHHCLRNPKPTRLHGLSGDTPLPSWSARPAEALQTSKVSRDTVRAVAAQVTGLPLDVALQLGTCYRLDQWKCCWARPTAVPLRRR